ncbi:hypothetical protein L6452_36138 [Arctium lappa]|uniref:Uncharacterized protein n=1 Tax=Arctium lappa TaxID=4217 RepID=A0ACB8Y986_ARCLA|nr:hypothetical protein L6452_36138 [Arctium lappa]
MNSSEANSISMDENTPVLYTGRISALETEGEKKETAHLCLMSQMKIKTEADSNDEVYDQMHAMKIKLQELESNLKREKGVITDKNQLIQKLSNEITEKKVLIEVFHKDNDTNAKEKTIILKENSDLKSQFLKSDIDIYELKRLHASCTKENFSLLGKLKSLEEKLYKMGQTEQTIFLNKPKEEIERWGIGYKNPHCLQKGMSEVPGLYDHLNMQLARKLPAFKTFWTKLSKEDEANETEKRMKSAKVHLPFYYAKLNNSYDENPIYKKKETLSSDFFLSYTEKEMEAKPIKGKLYVPPLVLEHKISELETSLSDAKLLINIEQSVFTTVFSNTVLSKASNSKELSGSSNKGIDFLNSDGSLDNGSNLFDFNAKLPNHSSFVKKTLRKTSKPVNSAKSTKAFVDKSVSVNAKSAKGKNLSQHSQKPTTTGNSKKKHSFVAQKSNSRISNLSAMSKKRLEVKSEWQPKQEFDETAISCSSVDCNKITTSKDDIIVDVAFSKPKLVDSRKKFSKQQLFQLSLYARKCSNYDRHDYASCQDSDIWFGTYHVPSYHSNSLTDSKKQSEPKFHWVPKSFANAVGSNWKWIPKKRDDFVLQVPTV